MTNPIIPAAALAQHTALVGKTGSGKTSTAKLIVEQVVAEGARVCVLDPIKSDWWGVISSADGKRPGLPFHVLGGPHAHVPLHSGAGAAIAELVARGELTHSILDMADFEPGGQQRFFVAFADTLLKRMRGVLYLVLEEAHEFAPKERAGFEKENLAIHFAKKLATAGRSKGIRLILATQRTQSLHNALLGSCDTLIAHRLTAPADQEPVTKWLKANVDKDTFQRVAAELSSLKTGTGWLCSGEARVFERIQFPRIRTFDNSATPTNDAGEVHVHGGHVDLEALRALIGTAVTEAEANDPKKLKARIKELERKVRDYQDELAAGATAEGINNVVEQTEARVRAELEDLADQRAAAALAELRKSARPHAEALYHALANGSAPSVPESRDARIHPKGETITPVRAPKPAMRAPSAPVRGTKRPARETPKPPTRRSDTSIGGTPRKMLNAIAMLEALGDPTPRQITVAGWLGITLSGTWRTYLSELRTAGLIQDHADKRISLTDAGREVTDPHQTPPTLAELHDAWKSKLGSTQARMLDVVIEAYPDSVDRDELAAAVGIQITGTFRTYLSELRTPGLVRDVSKGGALVATELLFPPGLK
jgi:hypothetical protein